MIHYSGEISSITGQMFASGRTPMSSIDHCVDHPLGSGLSDGRRKPVSWRSSGQVIEETGKGNALFTMIEKRIAITGFTECHVAVDFFFFFLLPITFS